MGTLANEQRDIWRQNVREDSRTVLVIQEIVRRVPQEICREVPRIL